MGATLLKAKGQGTILDDDAGGKIEFTAPVFTVTEGTALSTVTVRRTGSTCGDGAGQLWDVGWDGDCGPGLHGERVAS